MPEKIQKLFVYGTLLQGEPRSNHLDDCKLIQIIDVPGKLYNTGKGYPAAVFEEEESSGTVTGELYSLCANHQQKFNELDEVEGVVAGLYMRRTLTHRGHSFHVYEAGEKLKKSMTDEDKILPGSWRRHASKALKDPVGFAIRFEKSQRKYDEEQPSDDFDGTIFLRGDIPVLVTAPHATTHVRVKMTKSCELYTGALSVISHSLTGAHALYTHRMSNLDPNYYDDCPFKERLESLMNEHDIRFVIDIHGTGSGRAYDIFPGVGLDGEFLIGKQFYLAKLYETALREKILIGSLDIFPAAKQMTVAKFAATKLGVPAMQVEINRRLRLPEDNPTQFEKLVDFLSSYILSINEKKLTVPRINNFHVHTRLKSGYDE